MPENSQSCSDCKTSIPGSNPGGASKPKSKHYAPMPETTAFGMGRMSELMAESNGLDVAIYTCTTMEDAERWLGSEAI